jgi:hypothetical protein
MTAKGVFYLLRYWLGVLDSATAEVVLDQRTRGPGAWQRNDLAFINQMRMQNAAAEGLRLWREAKQLVADDASPENVKALAACERLIHRYLARFDPDPPPTKENHDARLTVH